MNIFFEIHKDIPREGPGNRETTRRTFESLRPMLPERLRILDIGCGPGDQTLELAHASKSEITAVDIQEPFLNDLLQKAQQEGVGDYIQTMKASMFDLELPEASYDLIWSEGAIYIMGFENGIRSWKKFLKPGGFLVVSELSWLTDAPSAEPYSFWKENYPGMKSVSENASVIEDAGYTLLQHSVLPEEGWQNYYGPLEQRVQALTPSYEGDAEALGVLRETQREIELFERFSTEYGYVFYVMKKPAQ